MLLPGSSAPSLSVGYPNKVFGMIFLAWLLNILTCKASNSENHLIHNRRIDIYKLTSAGST